jgi:hypothetical protein
MLAMSGTNSAPVSASHSDFRVLTLKRLLQLPIPRLPEEVRLRMQHEGIPRRYLPRQPRQKRAKLQVSSAENARLRTTAPPSAGPAATGQTDRGCQHPFSIEPEVGAVEISRHIQLEQRSPAASVISAEYRESAQRRRRISRAQMAAAGDIAVGEERSGTQRTA